MTETKPTYVRVNVSTATSVPEYDENGDRKAEVDMMLPANLISQTDGVKRAEMGVMKMSIPLGNLKGPILPIIEAGLTSSGVVVYPRGYVGITKFHFIAGDQTSSTVNDGSVVKASNVTRGAGYIWYHPLSYKYEYPKMSQPELRILREKLNQTREYQTSSLHEYLNILSGHVTTCFRNMFVSSYADVATVSKQQPLFHFTVNSDNTISLLVYIKSPVFDYSFAQPTPYIVPATDNNLTRQVYGSNLTSVGTRASSWHACHELGLFVSKDYADALPTLPWTALVNRQDTSSRVASQLGDSDIVYMLRTDQATIYVHEGPYQCYPSQEPPAGENPLFTVTKTIEYKFPFADATSLANLQCLALTMNGTAFNQQVYPVNMSATEMSDAQTMSLPVIDVYYPLWKTPSDLNTNMIVIKENFIDSGPVTIDPSLLKERHIKFKIYCIMNDGKMKEFTIPRNASFSFQLCFALYR